MSPTIGRARSAFLVASAAALLAAWGPAPQRVAALLVSSAPTPATSPATAAAPAARLAPPAQIRAAAGTAFILARHPGEQVSSTSWVVTSIRGDSAVATLVMGHPLVASSPAVAPVLADCDRQMRQQAASDLHTSVAVPFVLSLTPGATTGARVSVVVRHTLAAGLYLAVLDTPVPTRGPPPCPAVAATDVPIASRIAPGQARRTWYLWAVFPSTITAAQPNPDVGASAAGIPVPRVLFDGLATGFARTHTPTGDGTVVCHGLTTTYWLTYLPSVFATRMLDPCRAVG
ncbi:MAG: hypothetical protein ACXVYY_06105 [Oryzihumus sp.]